MRNTSMHRRSESGAIRKRTAVAAAGFLVAALVPVVAFANLGGSTFESTDGNLVHAGANLDWDNAPNLQPGIDVASGSGDNSFGQGTKEDDTTPTVVAGSIPPNKSDLTRFYVANNTGTNGHKYIYLAWERTNTLGSANMDFEINQLAQPDMTTLGLKNVGATRSPGDLLVRYDFGGSGAPVLSLVKWLTGGTDGAVAGDCNASNALPCWGALPGATEDNIDGLNDNQIDLTVSGFADGAVNACDPSVKKCTISTHDPIGNLDLAAATFGEAGIDLTAAGVFPAGQCRNFGSAYLKSRSSDSFTAETKDFIAPISINVNNCGSLTIKKVTNGGSGAFGFTSTNLADQTPSDASTTFTLATTGSGSGGAATTSSTYHGLLANTYDVAENTRTGWTLDSIACVNADSTSHAATINVSSRALSVPIAVGDDVTCTFTNSAKATITFKKVTNPTPDTADTTFTFDPSDNLQLGTFGLKNGGTKSYDVVPGTYSAAETDPAPAYDLTGRSCVNTVGGASHIADTSVGGAIAVTLSAGEDVTCTFTNTKRGSLTITKTDDASHALDGVVFTLFTDNSPVGGAAPHGNEDTTAGLTCTTGTTVPGACSIANIPLGDYWIVETTPKSGYAAAADQRLTVTAGSSATKTFVDPRQFHVITIVCQDSDSSLHQSDVTLDGTTTSSLDANGLTTFNTDHTTSLTQAQLCSLGGASFGPKQAGTHNGSVVIN